MSVAASGTGGCSRGFAAYTGPGCYAWAGHLTGRYFACQGKILVSADTVQAMAHAFESAKGELADQVAATLAARDQASAVEKEHSAFIP